MYEYIAIVDQINSVHTLLRVYIVFAKLLRGVQKTAKKRPRGRPRTGKVRVQIKLSPKAWSLIKQRASKLEISRSEYIERAVLKEPK